MNRTFASKMVLSIGQKMRDLISKGLPYQSGFHDPLWLAMMKVKMTIHAQLLTSLLQDLFNTEDPILLASDANQKMQALYQELWDSYYECTMRPHSYTFNTFWEKLVSYHNIPKEELDKYEHAKIQTCILWKTLGFLFRFGQESDESAYVIRKDVDFIEGAFDRGCSNTLLDRAFSLMSSDDYFPTIFYDWKDNPLPAVLKPECSTYEFQKKKPQIGRFQYGNKTLGDVWQDYTLISNLNKEAPKTAVLLHNAEHELAQTLGELTETYISTIELFCQPTDLHGLKWDDAEMTEAEHQELEKLKQQIEQLTSENAAKDRLNENLSVALRMTSESELAIARSNENLTKKDWEAQKVYSQQKNEKLREMLGETLKETPLVLPNNLQKKNHPDCRWIFTCSRSESGRIVPSIEKFVTLWRGLCTDNGLDYWSPTVLANGFYLLLDGYLTKGIVADPKLKRKFENALGRSKQYENNEQD